MPASPVLVDSSYYIQLARQGRDPLQALALTAAERDLVVCGVIRCEVGRGIRLRNVLQKFQAFWDVMLNVPTDNRLWQKVEETVWHLDREGIVLPLTDIIIACCALRVGAVVLTFDRHFTLMPGLTVVNRLEV